MRFSEVVEAMEDYHKANPTMRRGQAWMNWLNQNSPKLYWRYYHSIYDPWNHNDRIPWMAAEMKQLIEDVDPTGQYNVLFEENND